MEQTGSLVLVRQGLQRSASKWGVLGLLYATNLLITLPLAMAFRSALSVIVGNTPVVDELFPGFFYSVFSDLTRVHADAITVFRNAFTPVVFVSVVVHAILGVGLVRVMDTNGGAREFFGGIVSFGWRAFKLLLIWLLFGAVLLLVVGFLSVTLFSALTEGDTTEGNYLFAAGIFAFLIGITLAVISLGAEYSRVLTVRENRDAMFRVAWDGLVFVVSHPVRMLLLHGIVLLVLVAATLLYWLVEDVVGMTTVIGVIVMFLVQQAFILYRLMTRMWHTANGVRFVAIFGQAKRPSYVQAPSLHERGSSYREPVERRPGPVQQEKGPEQQKGDARSGGRSGSGQGGRQGYRRRGRRRGGSGRGGGPQTQGKPGAAQPPQQKPEDQSSPQQRSRSRRRRRPPKRGTGNT